MKRLRNAVAFALVLTLVLSLCPTGFAAPETVSDFCNDSEWENLRQANIARVENSLAPLSTFPLLNSLARTRATETLVSYNSEHLRPDGREFWTIIEDNNVKYTSAAENIATGQRSALEVHNDWMNSSGHRANILNANKVHLSTGRAENNWAQLFVGGCTPTSMRIVSGSSGGHYKTGTDIHSMDEVIVLTCADHGESYMPLIEGICSGYDPDLPDVAQTITVSLGAYGLSAMFDVTLDYVPQDMRVGDFYVAWIETVGKEGYSVVEFYGEDGADFIVPDTVNGEKVTRLAADLFDHNTVLGNVSIPDTVWRIGEEAFLGATMEGEFYIPASVTELGDNALSYLHGCTAFVVDPDNPSFTSIDGVLYNKDVTELINYPLEKQDKVYVVPESVTKIHQYALDDVYALNAIVVPNPDCFATGDMWLSGTYATVYCDPNSTLYASIDEFAGTSEVKDIALASDPFGYDITAEEAADILNSMGLFNGTDKGYELERVPNRQEAVTMLVRLLGMEQIAKDYPREHPFTDVEAWASPNVGYAYEEGLTNGTSATTFGALEDSSCVQYITFVLRALGYDDSEGDFVWNRPWELSDEIGLTNGQYDSADTLLTRGDMVLITYAALECWMAKRGVTLGTWLFGDNWK